MTRHHAESNINILLTRNLPIDSGARQWSHLKLDVPGQGGGKFLEVDGQGVGILKIRQYSSTPYVYRTLCDCSFKWRESSPIWIIQ